MCVSKGISIWNNKQLLTSKLHKLINMPHYYNHPTNIICYSRQALIMVLVVKGTARTHVP